MFATVFTFKEILKWFQQSEFDYMLFYVSGYGSSSDVNEGIVRNQRDIDRLTGDNIAYIYFTGESDSEDSNIYRVDPHNIISSEQILCNYSLTDQVSEYYNISRFDFPALVIISKHQDNPIELFPVKNTRELELYFKPIGLINAYLSESDDIRWQMNSLDRLSDQIENIEETIGSNIKEIERCRQQTEYFKSDPDIPDRVQSRYKLLLSKVKALGIKQNAFEDLFSCGPYHEFDLIWRRWLNLGLSSDFHDDVESFVSDLNRIGNFCQFSSCDGNVSAQVHKSFASYIDKARVLESKNSDLRVQSHKLQNELSVREKERQHLNERLDLARESCANLLAQHVFLKNSKEFIDNLHVFQQIDLLTLLRSVRDKTLNINAELHKLDIMIENRRFDTFISCKSQDYEAACEVYRLLKEHGHEPFIAYISLREMASDNYGYLIRKTIGICRNMIVYASKLEYLSTSYVSMEWNQFLDELSAGYVNGKLFTIIPESAHPSELPAGLRTRQFFTINSYRNYLLDYLDDRIVKEAKNEKSTFLQRFLKFFSIKG